MVILIHIVCHARQQRRCPLPCSVPVDARRCPLSARRLYIKWYREADHHVVTTSFSTPEHFRFLEFQDEMLDPGCITRGLKLRHCNESEAQECSKRYHRRSLGERLHPDMESAISRSPRLRPSLTYRTAVARVLVYSVAVQCWA